MRESHTLRRNRRAWRLALLLILGFLWPGLIAPHAYPASASNPVTLAPPAQLYLPAVSGVEGARLLIAAAHMDSALIGEPDEAFLLWNVGGSSQNLAGWQISTRTRRASFPADIDLILGPGQRLWCTAQSGAFLQTFGKIPACTWNDAAPIVPGIVPLEGSLILANTGGFIQLHDAAGTTVDTLLYGAIDTVAPGWSGPPAQLYNRGGIGLSGQIWHRKQDPRTDLPIDTDLAEDWAGDLSDIDWGRRVRRPGWLGWDAASLAHPQHGAAESWVTVAIAPEGIYGPLAHYLIHAQSTIDLSLFTFEHPELAQLLAQRAADGVQVRLWLEGSPPGGVTLLQRWSVAHMAQSGVEVYYSVARPDAPRGYVTRYRFAHAKYGIIDSHIAFVGSENFGRESMPVPGAYHMPQGGRRGHYLFTAAPPVVEALQRIFAADYAPDRFLDLLAYDAEHPRYGAPPADYFPPPPPVYPVATAPFAEPLTVEGAARFVVISAPEHALRPDDGLHVLIRRAGAGDAIWIQQLYEHKNWGSSDSNPIADPNPRLQMLIDAARRGAQVRIQLDSLFDNTQSLRNNQATVDYLHTLAAAEGLDIEARVGNPTGGGLHSKLYLVRVGDEHWSAVGSLNGSEISHKMNREVVLLVDHPLVYERLLEVFLHDWALVTHQK